MGHHFHPTRWMRAADGTLTWQTERDMAQSYKIPGTADDIASDRWGGDYAEAEACYCDRGEGRG